MRPALPSVALIVCFMSLSGCGTMQAYPGPALPDDQTALITDTYFNGLFAHFGSCIYSVDGKALPKSANEVRVLPGKHIVEATYYACPFSLAGKGCDCDSVRLDGTTSLTFSAEAGHGYQVTGVRNWQGSGKPLTMHVWIQDMQTGAVVGGSRPPD